MGNHEALFRRFLRVMGVRPWHLAAPLGLAILAAALDGIAMALLVPLARGIAGDSFRLLWDLPVLRSLEPAFHRIPAVAAAPNRAAFLLVVGLILSANLGRIFVNYLNLVLVDYRQGVYAARARSYTFQRFIGFGKLYFDRTSQGKLGRLLGYSTAIPELFGQALKAMAAGLRLAVHVAILLTISWPLTLLIGLVFPLVQGLLKRVIDRIRGTARRISDEELELSRKTFNLFSSIPLVKAYHREAASVDRYSGLLERLRELGARHSVWARWVAPLQSTVVVIALVGAAVAAVWLTGSDDPAELSTFCAFLVIARQTLPMFGTFSDLRALWARFGPRLDQLAKVFDDRDKHAVPGGERTFAGLRHGIELRELTFAYGGAPVLTGLSTTIPAGRTTALVGPTGSGKSTVVALIARLYDCPPGSILFDGVDVREFSLESLAARSALVSQDVLLFNDSLRSNLTFGLDRTVPDAELGEACRRARLTACLEGLDRGFDTPIGDRGVRLSGGEKQRVAIARALLRDADLVILDEATAALDSRTEEEVMGELQGALAGRTVIVVAHRLSTVRDADRILVLENGRLVEQGDWATLCKSGGTFRELWRAQDSGVGR